MINSNFFVRVNIITFLLFTGITSNALTNRDLFCSQELKRNVHIEEAVDSPCKLKWEKFDKFYDKNNKVFSEFYKKLLIHKYKGKRVMWTGTVSASTKIEDRIVVCIKMNQFSEFCNLHLELCKNAGIDEKDLIEGTKLTFSGFLMIDDTYFPPMIEQTQILRIK